MMKFEKLTEYIYRLKVPFYDIYTAVFALRDGDKWILFDSGDKQSDVQTVIIPALETEGIIPDILAISHAHSDHSGGVSALSQAFPKARIKCAESLHRNALICKVETLYDNEMLGKRFRAVLLRGHTEKTMGIYDTEDKILLSGDGLQCCGVSRWGTGLAFPKAYLESIERVRALAPRRIIASHDYAPLGAEAEGEEVVKYLDFCREQAETLKAFIGMRDDGSAEQIAEEYGRQYPALPPLPKTTAVSIRNEVKNDEYLCLWFGQ